MRLKMTYIDTSGDDPVTHELFEGVDFRLNTPILQSSAEYGYSVSVDLNRKEDKVFFTSYRGPMKIAFELVDTDALVIETAADIQGLAAVAHGNVFGQCEAMGWDAQNNRLVYFTGTNTLRAYDPATNSPIDIAPGVTTRNFILPSGTHRFEGLTFIGNTMWGFAVSSGRTGPRVLCEFNSDLTGYTAHTVTGLPADWLGDIASAGMAAEGIYLNYNQQLWNINLTTYLATSIGALPYSDMFSLGAHKGHLYSIRVETANHAELYEVDKSDASLTRVGTQQYSRTGHPSESRGPELLVGVESLDESLNGLFYTSYIGESTQTQPLFRIP